MSNGISYDVKKIKLYFAVIYFINMSARAIFGPFITVYLQEKGLSLQHIGIVTSLNAFVIILSQPFWGIIADRLQSIKKTMVVCFVFQGLIVFNFSLANGILLVALVYCTSTFFSSPEGTLLDTWSIHSLKNTGEENSLGHLKLWGCLGYALCSVLAGIVINKYSTQATIPVYAVLLLCIGAFIHFSKISTSTAKPLKLKEMQVGRITRDSLFILFLIYIFFMQLPHRSSFTFFPALINELGGNKAMVGYASAVMFLSEAVISYFSRGLLKRIKPVYLIISSAGFFALWQFLYSIVTSPQQIIFIAVLDGPAFALFTIGTLYYLDSLAPKELRTTYQTIAYAVYFGLSGVVGNAVGGWCIANRGYKTMYNAGCILIIVATVIFTCITLRNGKTGKTTIQA